MLPQLILNGVAAGSLYALVALAMVIIYKASEVPNFAQGEMAMLSTFVAYMLLDGYGLSFGLAAGGALLFSIILGSFLEFAFLRRAKSPSTLDLVIVTLGFQLLLHGLAGWKWGPAQKHFPLPVSSTKTFAFSSIVLSHLNALTIGLTLLLMLLLFLFFRYTKLGIAMKATQQNPLAARINGIRTDRILSITWAMSSGIGAIAGMLFAPIATLDPHLMWDPLIKGFAAAVLGGMTTLVGAAAGGYLLGIIENLFGAYISLEFKSVVAFLMIIIVLWFRPSGLFSHHYERKV